MTQADLSAKSGVSKSAIAKLELGMHKATLRTLKQLADALGITPQQLIHEAPTPYEARGAA